MFEVPFRRLVAGAAALIAVPAFVVPSLASAQAVTVAADDYATAVLADSPVAYYRLDDTSGTTMTDSSGNGTDGTYSGSPTFGAEDGIATSTDAATTFNDTATASYATTTAVPRDALTIEFWAKTADVGASAGAQWYGGAGFVDGEAGGVVNDYGVTLVDGRVAFGVGNGDTTIYSPDTINDDTWHMVDVTYDSTNGHMWVFVDGAQVAAKTGPRGSRTAPTALKIAQSVSGSSLHGSMDEVALYETVLTPTQVANHYEAATGVTESVPLVKTWDAVDDAAVYTDGDVSPAVANPQDDRFHNADVWSYAYYNDTASADAPSFAPADYGLDADADLAHWGAGAVYWHPTAELRDRGLGINKTGRKLQTSTPFVLDQAIDLFPSDHMWSILGWRAPETTAVSVSAFLAAADTNYNSTRWYLLRAESSTATSSTELASGVGSGSSYTHTETVDNLDVAAGEMLYLLVGPGEGNQWTFDSTQVNLTVTQLSTTLTPTLTDDTGGASVAPGDVVTYTATVANDGPDPADTTTVVDTIPAGMRFDAAGTDAACTPDDPDPGLAATVSCDLGDIAAGGSASAKIALEAVDEGPAENRIDVTSHTVNLGADSVTHSVTIAVPLTGYAAAVVADSPSIYYRLGEATGTTAADSSGNGNDGTYGGGATLGTAGALVGDPDTAISGDAPTAALVTEDGTGLPTGNAARTVETWFRTAANTSEPLFVYGAESTYGMFQVSLDPGETGTTVHTLYWGTDNSWTFPVDLMDGNWHHLAVTYAPDAGGGSNDVNVFVDGVESNPQAAVTLNTTTAGLQLGRGLYALGDGPTSFTGDLDEFAVYPTVLSADAIAAHYAASGVTHHVPGEPTGVSADPGDGLATVSFTPPADPGDPVATSFTVTAHPHGAADDTGDQTATGTEPPIAVTGLVNGTTYDISVVATNSVGDGAAGTTEVTPRTVPDAPDTLVATGGVNQVSLTWAAPATDGGAPVLGYRIYRSTTSDMAGATELTADLVTTLSYVDRSGTVGVTYYYAAKATNVAGDSVMSAPDSAKATAPSTGGGGSGGGGITPTPTPTPTPSDGIAPCPWNGNVDCYTFAADGQPATVTTDDTVVMVPDGAGAVTVVGDGNAIDGLSAGVPVDITVTGDGNYISLAPGSTVTVTGVGNYVITDGSTVLVQPGSVITVVGDGNTILSTDASTDVIPAPAMRLLGSPAIARSAVTTSSAGSVVVVHGARNGVTTGRGADQIAVEGAGSVVDSGPGRDYVTVGRVSKSAPAALRAAYVAAFPSGAPAAPKNVVVKARGGRDVLIGGGAADHLFGGASDDTLLGRAGDDLLFGQRGDDLLHGGRGDDRLFDGRGADIVYAR